MKALLGVLLLSLSRQDPKLPIPSPQEQKAVDADIRSLFKEEFSKKDRESRRLLAQKLLAQALDPKNTPASRFVLLAFARDFSAEALDIPQAFEAIEQLDRIYELGKAPLAGASFSINLNGQKSALLGYAKKWVTGPADAAIVAEAYLKIARSSLAIREFDDASAAADQALKASKGPVIAARAGDLAKEIPELKREEELVSKAKATLETKPDDPEANLVYGRYLLFILNDAEKGIPRLSISSDAALKDISRKEIAAPEQSQGQFDLGEAWWTLADKEKSLLQKKRYQARARFWYDLAIKDAPGLVRVKIQKRIEELEAKASPEVGIDLLRLVDPKKDAVAGTWAFEGGLLVSTPGSSGTKLQLPYIAPPEYDLKVVVEKKSGTHVVVDLVGGESQFMVVFEEGLAGLALVDGKGANENETTFRGNVFSSGRAVTLLFSVRRTRITISADGKPFIDWVADYKKLSLQDYWKIPNAKTLGLGGMQANIFSKVILTPISGQGKKLR